MTFKHYILGSHYYIVSYLPWHIGFDDVTNKTGAGLTTFIIGFALKDIGENFLAGILMAFQRPFQLVI
jgi:hypothetical protein